MEKNEKIVFLDLKEFKKFYDEFKSYNETEFEDDEERWDKGDLFVNRFFMLQVNAIKTIRDYFVNNADSFFKKHMASEIVMDYFRTIDRPPFTKHEIHKLKEKKLKEQMDLMMENQEDIEEISPYRAFQMKFSLDEDGNRDVEFIELECNEDNNDIIPPLLENILNNANVTEEDIVKAAEEAKRILLEGFTRRDDSEEDSE